MTLSSCKAEYIAASLCACQVVWLVNLIDEIEGKNRGGVTLKIDNISTVNLPRIVLHMEVSIFR